MGILEKLNLTRKNTQDSKTLSNWDSREVCIISELNTTDVQIVQDFIEIHDNYTIYKDCFINNVFLSEITSCFIKRKEFINCEFEIKNLFNCANTLFNFEFKNCTFYIADYERNLISFNFEKTLENKLYSNNNVVYKKSYVECLAEKYKQNLNKVPKKLLKGISLNYTDLSNCILPKNKDFFMNLSDTEVHNIKFPKIDLNDYDTSRVRFANIIFTEDSVLSAEAMQTGIFCSTLPKIDFENITKNYKGFLRFYNCTFSEQTIFPKDDEFFTRCVVRDCLMPTYDYSNYKIAGDSFHNCIFTEESKIPNEFFTSKYIKNIEKIAKVPSSYLDKIVMMSDLKNPKDFYTKNLSRLSEKSRFLFCKKYKIC